jgi:hypothetical protein
VAEQKIRFDMELLNDVPFKEQIEFEEFAGIPYTGIGAIGTSPPARVVVGLLWLMRRRTDPTFTIEQALEHDYNDVDMSGTDDEGNPTEAAEPTPLQPLAKPASRKARATA